MLAYYKVASLDEMTETAYRRAVEVLKRKRAKQATRETRSCPGLSGCIRTLPNGTAGACKGLGPATLR